MIHHLALALLLSAAPPSHLDADASGWVYAGADRAAAKNRKPADGKAYKTMGPLTLPQFFAWVTPLGSKALPKMPPTALEGMETYTVTITAYLLAARFERNEDHDIHFQIGATPKWDTDQLIVEAPAGPEFVPARKTIWGLIRADSAKLHPKGPPDSWIMLKPIRISVTGFLFLDAHHRPKGSTGVDLARDNGGRGIKKDGKNAVRGIWELHPVIKAEVGPQ